MITATTTTTTNAQCVPPFCIPTIIPPTATHTPVPPTHTPLPPTHTPLPVPTSDGYNHPIDTAGLSCSHHATFVDCQWSNHPYSTAYDLMFTDASGRSYITNYQSTFVRIYYADYDMLERFTVAAYPYDYGGTMYYPDGQQATINAPQPTPVPSATSTPTSTTAPTATRTPIPPSTTAPQPTTGGPTTNTPIPTASSTSVSATSIPRPTLTPGNPVYPTPTLTPTRTQQEQVEHTNRVMAVFYSIAGAAAVSGLLMGKRD